MLPESTSCRSQVSGGGRRHEGTLSVNDLIISVQQPLDNISCPPPLGQQIVRNLRASVFASILRQEVAFFDRNKTGELINRLSSDTAVVGRSVTDNLSDGLRAVAQAAAGVSMMVSPCCEGKVSLLGWKYLLFRVCWCQSPLFHPAVFIFLLSSYSSMSHPVWRALCCSLFLPWLSSLWFTADTFAPSPNRHRMHLHKPHRYSAQKHRLQTQL